MIANQILLVSLLFWVVPNIQLQPFANLSPLHRFIIYSPWDSVSWEQSFHLLIVKKRHTDFKNDKEAILCTPFLCYWNVYLKDINNLAKNHIVGTILDSNPYDLTSAFDSNDYAMLLHYI